MPAEQNRDVVAAIEDRRGALAEEITNKCFDARPELVQRYGRVGREKCLQDTNYHLSYLAEAIGAESPALFGDYVAWAKVLLASVRVPARDLVFNLEVMRDALQAKLPPDAGNIAAKYVNDGIAAIPEMPTEIPTFISEVTPLSDLAKDYLKLLLEGNRHLASRRIRDAVDGGTSIRDIYQNVFEPVQHEIGRLWQTNRISVAEEHYCTAATQLIMSQLYPQMFGREKNGLRMVATCVGSELHEIGVRMVADFFEMEGWDTFYLGANVPITSIIRTLKEKSAHLLAVSVTMTFHVRAVKELIRAIRAEKTLAHVRILVGGYPFKVDPELWKYVGADGFGRTAEETMKVASELFPGSNS